MKSLTANKKGLGADLNFNLSFKGMPKRTQLLALVGVAVLIGAFVVKTFVLQAPTNIVSPPLVAHNKPVVKKPPKVDPGLPASLRRALLKHRVVVAVLFAPGVPGDSAAVAAAREGAGSAHVGFASLNVGIESIARVAALKLTSSSEPSVIVIRRPGTVSMVLPGYADSEVVAAAAMQKPAAAPTPASAPAPTPTP